MRYLKRHKIYAIGGSEAVFITEPLKMIKADKVVNVEVNETRIVLTKAD